MSGNKTIIFDDLILERIIDIADGMLKSGAEIKRVEETVSLICAAYGANNSDVWVIKSIIIVTARFDNNFAITQTRRIKKQQVDMRGLEFYNQLSREICISPMTNEEISEKLHSKSKFNYNRIFSASMWGLASASFTMFFGGRFTDAIISFFIGGFLCLVYNLLYKVIDNYYCVIALCSVFGGIIPLILSLFTTKIDPFFINIGNVMLLIPGVALTTAIRDMFSGDTISGLFEFFESVLIGLVIAFGFAIMNSVYTVDSAYQSWLLQVITALTGAFGFSIIFNCRLKIASIGAFGGMIAWVIVVLMLYLNFSEYIGYFFAAMAITLFSRLMAKICKCPITPFLRVAVIPLVPGKSLYLTMVYALNEEWQLLFKQGIKTVLYAVCISAGVLLISIILDIIDKKHRENEMLAD